MGNDIAVEAQDALDVLNEDCWRLVFQEADSRDKKSLSQTCFLFHQILIPEECTWKLEQVLPHLFNYLPVAEGDRWKAMYDSRLVCKTWCSAIDEYLEAHPDTVNNTEIAPAQYRFEREADIQQFLENFRDHSGNPFVGRRMTLYVYPLEPGRFYVDDDEANRYFLKQQELGERFGGEIWTVTLLFPHFDSLQNYRNSQALLSTFPNLKCLRICNQIRSIDRNRSEELAAYMEEHPLPSLPLLKRLDCVDAGVELSKAVVDRYSSHLQHLKIYSDVLTDVAVDTIRSLKTLVIDDVKARNTLEVLRGLQSPLESLCCILKGGSRGTSWLWSVDTFVENIIHLRMISHLTLITFEPLIVLSDRDQNQVMIRHEGITHIEIICYSERLSFSADLLQLFPNVEGINFNCLLSGVDGQDLIAGPAEETIQLRQSLVRGEAYQSNVWELMPSLKKIRVKLWGSVSVSKSYFREKYNRIRHNI